MFQRGLCYGIVLIIFVFLKTNTVDYCLLNVQEHVNNNNKKIYK